MTADLFFSNVEFFGAPSAQRIRVKVEEEFVVVLSGPEPIRGVFADNDVVLDFRPVGDGSYRVGALKSGTSELQVQDDTRAVIFYLTVEVFNPAEATSLGLTPGPVVPK